jgi:hypothetical protein
VAAQFSAASVDLTPDPQPASVMRISRSAPAVTAVKVTRTSSELLVQITGYSTAREITQAVFQFRPASGNTLQQTSVTVPLESLFSTWYQDTASMRYGSQFLLSQPFTIQGDPNAVICERVTLTNRLGSTAVPVN